MNHNPAVTYYRPVRIVPETGAPPPIFTQHASVGPAPAPPAGLPVIRPRPGARWHVGPAVGYGSALGAVTDSSASMGSRMYWGATALLAFAAQVAGAYYGYRWGRQRGIGVGAGVGGFLVAGSPVWITSAIVASVVGLKQE